MSDSSDILNQLSAISFTMLKTLAARGAASKIVPEVEFQDLYAAQLLKALPVDLSVYQQDVHFVKPIALRAKIIDQITREFFQKHPGAIGISLGCGLCTRARRMLSQLNGQMGFEWYDIDLPEVIAVRLQYLETLPGEHLIPCSVTDLSWLEAVRWQDSRALLLIMEGVIHYLPSEQSQSLLTDLGNRLGNCDVRTEMIFDYIHPSMLGNLHLFKKIGNAATPYQSGFYSANAIRQLHPSIRIISEPGFFSQLSSDQAHFELEFETLTDGEKPYNMVHLSFG